MSLRHIQYQEDYRSGYDDLVAKFYKLCLSISKKYWRAVGDFSSSALEYFGSPLGEFVKRGGNIQLATSVELSNADLQAIQNSSSLERKNNRNDIVLRLRNVLAEQFRIQPFAFIMPDCPVVQIKAVNVDCSAHVAKLQRSKGLREFFPKPCGSPAKRRGLEDCYYSNNQIILVPNVLVQYI